MIHLKLVSVAIVASLFAGVANAQVFKCNYVDKSTRQTKTVYTDEPCTKTGKQILVEFKSKPQQTPQKIAQNIQQNQSLNRKQDNQASSETLDNAVTQAVLAKNFELAKSLAVTKEHWRLIAVANQAPAPVKPVEAVEEKRVAASNPCDDATKEYDYAARVNWRDSDLIAAKKSIMYAACGVNEPSPPVIIGQTYGYPYSGISTTRWLPAVVYQHHDHRHHAQRAPEGLSVNINSGGFGLQVGGNSQHSSRYSQSSTTFVSRDRFVTGQESQYK